MQVVIIAIIAITMLIFCEVKQMHFVTIVSAITFISGLRKAHVGRTADQKVGWQ
jgi:hypothetical protein